MTPVVSSFESWIKFISWFTGKKAGLDTISEDDSTGISAFTYHVVFLLSKLYYNVVLIGHRVLMLLQNQYPWVCVIKKSLYILTY